MSHPFHPTYAINGIQVGFDLTDLGAVLVGSCDDDGPTETVRFKCLWGDRWDLVRALLGGISVSGGSFSRDAPFQHPDLAQMYALGIPEIRGLKPLLRGDGWPAHQAAIVTAKFGVPTWQYFDNDPAGNNDPSGKAWTRTRFRESAEVFQPPYGSFYIGPFGGSSGKLIDDATVGLMRPRLEISMTRLLVPLIPLADTMDLIGTVNQDPIQFGDRHFPRGCVLFAGLNDEPRNDPAGYPCQDLEYTLLANHSVEWNEFMAKDGSYQYLNTKATAAATARSEYADWSTLPDPL